MFVQTDDGLAAGMFDVLVIAKDSETGRYHPMFLDHRPFAGAPPDDPLDYKAIRLKSKMHHTAGFDDREGAETFVREARESGSVKIDDENVMGVVEIEGWTADDPAVVHVLPNWRKKG